MGEPTHTDAPNGDGAQAPPMSHADEYLQMQCRFLQALQEKNLLRAFDISEEIEKRWPDHPNVVFFKKVMEEKAKHFYDLKAAGQLPDDGDDDDTSDDTEDSDSDHDEAQQKEIAKSENDMAAQVEKWEKMLIDGTVEDLKAELSSIGILRPVPAE